MSLAVAGLLAASTAAFAGEGDSYCGYQQTVRMGKPTLTLLTGKATTKTTANTRVTMKKPGS